MNNGKDVLEEQNGGFNHGEIGPREKLMDEETAMAIFIACGLPKPITKEEWKEYHKKMNELFRRIEGERKVSIIKHARRIAGRKLDLNKENVEVNNKFLTLISDKIPLSSEKIKSKNPLENFSELTPEQQELIMEMINKGLLAQEEALQNLHLEFEKDSDGNKIVREERDI